MITSLKASRLLPPEWACNRADNGRELASDDEDDLCEEELELMDQIEAELDADEDEDED